MANNEDYQFTLFHQSPAHGVTQQELEDEEIHYIGKVFKIPYDVYGTAKSKKHELEMDSLIMNIVTEDGEWEAVDGGVIERHEVRDLDSFDVWVMYRVPYHRIKS